MRILKTLGGAAAILGLIAAGAAQAEEIKIGVTPGPHAQILEQVKPIAAAKGLDIDIIEFSDYVVPNQALAAGDIQANSFQHQPYLDNQNADRGYGLVSIAKTVVFPLGIYSKKIKSLAELKDGDSVAIPNDPTNGGRALLLLQAQGVLKLREGAGLKATPLDIAENPKNLRIIELDAAQLPRSLDDTAASAVNTNYAVEAGLDPVKDPIAREAAESPYANVIAVRKVDADAPWAKTLVEAYHDQKIKDWINEQYKGALVVAW
ncbi:lipoprotein, YaeC family [Tistrella mobilis KA081020-065]|uniref:Lipoprotein, YaeC family n=1 Tax=Tistrella mobilis (strain KA081020-065) TaxID=1110502 RepID=I3TJB6_TISMK|nr:lipoprotein, YaeC family [Tistrella mobilis KA081020-065]